MGFMGAGGEGGAVVTAPRDTYAVVTARDADDVITSWRVVRNANGPSPTSIARYAEEKHALLIAAALNTINDLAP